MRHGKYATSAFLGMVALALLICGPMPTLAGVISKEDMEKYWQNDCGASIKDVSPFLDRDLLAKAEPDECFYGISDPRNDYAPYTLDIAACRESEGRPKANAAYVWGLVKSGDNLWFGTIANTLCLVIGGLVEAPAPFETDSCVCEFGESRFSPPLPPPLGDWRPPRIFVYNTVIRRLSEKVLGDPLLSQTVGLRSAGAMGDVVILGGPGLVSGINLFAFNSKTGHFLGSQVLPEYNNIRQWLVADDALYTAVGAEFKGVEGGKVLRWTGDLKDPFLFSVVGDLDGAGAFLGQHDGRLFVTTWPSGNAAAGLWMSPVIPKKGLTEEHAGSWKKVWAVIDYEPDPLVALTYGGGALASFGGYLYWGTMHVPMLATLAYFRVYGVPETEEEIALAILGTQRAISIFRGRNFGSDPEIELLYGSAVLPKYRPPPIGAGWEIVPNNMDGKEPTYGSSGFGNFFNNYTWAMAVFNDQLFVGTMDWSYLFMDILKVLMETQTDIPYQMIQNITFPHYSYGADLFRFPTARHAAVAESTDGVGNYTNYGIRTMVSEGDLYLGTANPMNLMTDPEGGRPEGGWELITLYEPRPLNGGSSGVCFIDTAAW